MQQQQRPQRGLNENYARELMELHTLGVDGGYTQKDVIELARILTGWTIDRPQQGGAFVFRPQMHDTGEKTLLGERFPAGAARTKASARSICSRAHPSTARHIAFKLAQRFVADEPPAGARRSRREGVHSTRRATCAKSTRVDRHVAGVLRAPTRIARR